MNRNIVKDFILDNINLLLLFLINNTLIIFYFYITTNGKTEVIYPLILSLFIFIIFFIINFLKYSKFIEGLKNYSNNSQYDIKVNGILYKKVNDVIKEIHNSYINKIELANNEGINRERFISQWIHNMKTPVSVIDLITQKPLNESKIEILLEEIKEENDKLLNELENGLNIIRLNEFSKDYVPQTIDLIEVVNKIINEKKKEFIYNNVFPKTNFENMDGKVLSDYKWNKFMLEQIISNAIKYSNSLKKSKSIYFKISKFENKTVLTIEDEGVGIPNYDMDRIFQPFFTGDNGRKHRNSSGIGLYIANEISQKLSHRISIESKQNKGTKVKIFYLSKL